MKRDQFFMSYFVLPLFFTFSMLVIGFTIFPTAKVQTEKVEGKQLMKENSAHTNEAVVVTGLHAALRHEADTSDSNVDQIASPVWHKELARAFYLVFE